MIASIGYTETNSPPSELIQLYTFKSNPAEHYLNFIFALRGTWTANIDCESELQYLVKDW
jgi:hypothetical protein